MSHGIGWAVEMLKKGQYVTRTGWNGKGMFLWLKTGAHVPADWCHDPILRQVCELHGGAVDCSPTVCMYTAQGTVVSGWLASQTDLLADDWEIVEPFPARR